MQQLPPAPPIIIRQQAEAMRTQAPIVIREKPPRAPGNEKKMKISKIYLITLKIMDVKYKLQRQY